MKYTSSSREIKDYLCFYLGKILDWQFAVFEKDLIFGIISFADSLFYYMRSG